MLLLYFLKIDFFVQLISKVRLKFKLNGHLRKFRSCLNEVLHLQIKIPSQRNVL